MADKYYIQHDDGSYAVSVEKIDGLYGVAWGSKKNAIKFAHNKVLDVARDLYFKHISFHKVPTLRERLVVWFRKVLGMPSE